MQMVAQWEASLEAACKPVVAAVPLISSYYLLPSKIMTTVCSGSISLIGMLDYAAHAVVFGVVTVAVPSMAADLVGGTVGLALGHAFEAAYTAQTITRIVNPITSAIKGTAAGVSGFARGSGSSFAGGGDAMSAAQNVVNQHQNRALPKPRRIPRPSHSIPSMVSRQATTTLAAPSCHRQLTAQEAAAPRSNISRAGRGSIPRTSPSISPDFRTAKAKTFHKLCRRYMGCELEGRLTGLL
jgi:hypothetical protein